MLERTAKMLTAALIAVTALFALDASTATAAPDDVDHTIRVFAAPGGDHAYKVDGKPRQVLAPKGSPAAHKMKVGRPDDIYALTGIENGRRFVVTGIISKADGKTEAWGKAGLDWEKAGQDWEKGAPAGVFYDRLFHVKNTKFYLYLDAYAD